MSSTTIEYKNMMLYRFRKSYIISTLKCPWTHTETTKNPTPIEDLSPNYPDTNGIPLGRPYIIPYKENLAASLIAMSLIVYLWRWRLLKIRHLLWSSRRIALRNTASFWHLNERTYINATHSTFERVGRKRKNKIRNLFGMVVVKV